MEQIEALGEPSSSSNQAPQSTDEQRSKSKRARSPVGLDENDADVEGEPTQGPNPEPDELYVTLRTDVVGVQYYRGLVGRGEYVMLRRQPENQYDANAVQVVNAGGTQVGHVPRAVAAKVAPYMDAGLITLEGRMIGQNLDMAKHFKLGMDLCIYGRPSHRAVLEPELAWATQAQQGVDSVRRRQQQNEVDGRFKGKGRVLLDGSVSGPSAMESEDDRRLWDNLKKVEKDAKQSDSLMVSSPSGSLLSAQDYLTADTDVTRLPLHPHPPGIASVDGRPVTTSITSSSGEVNRCGEADNQWMISHENPQLPKTSKDPPVQFWALQDTNSGSTSGPYWLNIATRTPQKDEPELGRGGILADGMGLGKTLTTLALILATMHDPDPEGYSRATLLVCPLSVLSNWQQQINDHVVLGKLSAYTYHGAAKDVSAKTLERYDIILTTYQTLASDATASAAQTNSPLKAKKAKTTAGPLLKVKWKRVVADEGHVLRNPKAKIFKLNAAGFVQYYFPSINISDCSSLQPDYFRSLLLRPLRNGDAAAAKLLRGLITQTVLRRTKNTQDQSGNSIVQLPQIEYFQGPVTLDDGTRRMYDEVREISAQRFQEAVRTGQGTANVLSLLTRMRQLCLSASLVPSSFLEELRQPPSAGSKAAVAVASIPPEQRAQLIDKLRRTLADDEDCPICFDILSLDREPRITDCGHPHCFPCIKPVIELQQKCPMCRHPISFASLLSLPADSSEYVQPDDHATVIKSAKITELLKFLKAFDEDDKTLVFSQFTSFLDHVAASLREEGIVFSRFDGSMSAKARQDVIQAFQAPATNAEEGSNSKVMLISLKSGAVGLNLTAASNVFLVSECSVLRVTMTEAQCDPWWQSAIEAQAIDRVHRMGQRKPVRVFQLIASDTVESKVLEIRRGKETGKDKKEARFEELRELFGV
ncbi:LOW QUALITY PROTEIN: hypothetical protein JCM24511_01515 [Saitozyma sp. JCM 24511]|nr:LOW QUALITY PROTEIN: hypothetical protein JCM24511_01515 [Saitozyma sp. JCM 24511]